MGWMDKAKKLAEQAQDKLDEAQKNFNKSDAPDAAPSEAVRHDEHGRPIQQEETPAAATESPSATPAAEEPEQAPQAAQAAAPPPPPSEGGANASPDPFKPIQ
jgi:hypothetical protein